MRRTRRGALAALALALAAAPAAAGVPGWEPARTLSPPETAAVEPRAATNARGDLAVAWRTRLGPFEAVQVTVRAAGARRWTPPFTLGPLARRVRDVRAVVGSDGRVLVAWLASGAPGRPGLGAFAALLPRSGRSARPADLGAASAGSRAAPASPPAVALTASGRAVVAWAAPEGVVAAAAPRSGRFGDPARVSRRPGARCASEGAPGLAATPQGGLLAWWDCRARDGRVRLIAALGRATGRFGRARATGVVGHGPTGAVLAPGEGGTIVGAAAVVDRQGAVRPAWLARSGAGRWTHGLVPAGTTVADGPAVARAQAGPALAAWTGPGADGRIAAWASVGAGPVPLGPAAALGAASRSAALGGAGVADSGAALVAWRGTAPAGGARAAVWIAVRPPGAPAFGPATARRVVGPMRGAPHAVVGAGGRALAVWARGPGSRAVVQAAVGQM